MRDREQYRYSWGGAHAMPQKHYQAQCRWCGKTDGSKVVGPANGAPPNRSPVMLGKCPGNLTGKHAPTWIPAF